MRILFIILAHKNPDQLIRLYNSLSAKDSAFVIHVCKNVSTKDFSHISDFFKNKRNVYFAKRERATWASYNLTRAVLNCFQLAERVKLKFDYLQIISGQDYPIKPVEHIQEFFEKNKGQQFLSYKAIDETTNIDEEYVDPVRNQLTLRDQSNRYKYPFIKIFKNIYIRIHNEQNPDPSTKMDFFKNFLRSNFRFFERKWFNESMPPYYGSNWININYACFKEILGYCSENRNYLKYHRSIFCPEELFFHTIILNSKFKDSCVNDNLHFITWDTKITKHPLILDKGNFEQIQDSEAHFARKFDLAIKPEIFDLIDFHILNPGSSLESSKLKLA